MPSFAGYFRPSDPCPEGRRDSIPQQAPIQEAKDHAVVSEDIPEGGQDDDKFLWQYQKDIRRVPRSGRHTFMLIAGIMIALVLVFSSVYLSLTRTSWRSSAKTPVSGASISVQNSYVFASPVAALADGVSIIRITVFILNGNGLGVPGSEVSLKYTGKLTMDKTRSVTDNFGRAIFEITSDVPGSYTINAETQGSVLPQGVSVSFQ